MVLVSACSVPVQEGHYPSALWRVEGADLEGTSYLFGTWKSRDARAFQIDAAVWEALAECDVLALEMHPNSIAKMRHKFALKELKPIASVPMASALRDPTIDMITSLMHRYSPLDSNEIQTAHPVHLERLLTDAVYNQDFPYEPQTHFYRQARALNIPIHGLEVPDPTRYKNEFGGSLKRWQNLEVYFQKIADNPYLEDSVLSKYLHGKLTEALKFKLSNAAPNEADLWQGTRQRNVRLMNAALKLMRAQPSFVAIDAMRLTGPKGLIENLRRTGYSVQPIYLDYPADTTVSEPSHQKLDWTPVRSIGSSICWSMPDMRRTQPKEHSQVNSSDLWGINGWDPTYSIAYEVILTPLHIASMPVSEETINTLLFTEVQSKLASGLGRASDPKNWQSRIVEIDGIPAMRSRTAMDANYRASEFCVFMHHGLIVCLVATAFNNDEPFELFEAFFNSIVLD